MRRCAPHLLLACWLSIAGPVLLAAPQEGGGACASPDSAEGIACLEADVRALLQTWVVAWADADAETYLGAYARTPPDASSAVREARDAERRAWLSAQQDVVITLDLESMGIGEEGTVDVIFVQHYRSAARTSSLRKQLFLIREGGSLKIRREAVLD